MTTGVWLPRKSHDNHMTFVVFYSHHFHQYCFIFSDMMAHAFMTEFWCVIGGFAQ